MPIIYPAQYKDRFGTESTIIIDDNRSIKLTLRGIEFSGGYFSLSVVSGANPDLTKPFYFFEDELCAYSLDFELPIIVINKGKEIETKLRTRMECGQPIESTGWTVHKRYKDGRTEKETERIDSYSVSFEIEIEDKIYKVSHPHGGFETPLIELSKQFPSEVYLKICLNCMLSEYPPNILGGAGLRCFKNAKNELKQVNQVKGNNGFLTLWIEKGLDVDETYFCTEFERRPPFVWR